MLYLLGPFPLGPKLTYQIKKKKKRMLDFLGIFVQLVCSLSVIVFDIQLIVLIHRKTAAVGAVSLILYVLYSSCHLRCSQCRIDYTLLFGLILNKIITMDDSPVSSHIKMWEDSKSI